MDSFQSQAALKTDEELVAILLRSQDYQAEFIKIIENEMIKRNIPLTAVMKIKDEANEISDRRIGQGEQGNALYIGLCFLSALLGGFISIVAGYIYAYSKRENSQGDSCYYYNEQTRKYGTWMMVTGVLMLLFWIFIGL